MPTKPPLTGVLLAKKPGSIPDSTQHNSFGRLLGIRRVLHDHMVHNDGWTFEDDYIRFLWKDADARVGVDAFKVSGERIYHIKIDGKWEDLKQEYPGPYVVPSPNGRLAVMATMVNLQLV
jgi:hypothetical protein